MAVMSAIAAVYLGYVFLSRYMSNRAYERRLEPRQPSSEQQAKFDATYGGTAVKIVQFYGRDGSAAEGQGAVLCYGVVNAKSVRIDPPVGNVYPAINRCMDVSPAHDTTYTLTATGNDGKTATQQFTVAVKPDVAILPRITDFRVTKHTVEQGKHYFTVAFAFENARKMHVDPPDIPALQDAAPFGQWIVSPEKTTTYTMTVEDQKGRTATRQLTVVVPK